MPPMMFALTAFVVNLIVMTGVFYVAGVIVVGKKRRRLCDFPPRDDFGLDMHPVQSIDRCRSLFHCLAFFN